MKAIKDTQLRVRLMCNTFLTSQSWHWKIINKNIGCEEMQMVGTATNRDDAKANFIKFAKLNGIKSYKFI